MYLSRGAVSWQDRMCSGFLQLILYGLQKAWCWGSAGAGTVSPWPEKSNSQMHCRRRAFQSKLDSQNCPSCKRCPASDPLQAKEKGRTGGGIHFCMRVETDAISWQFALWICTIPFVLHVFSSFCPPPQCAHPLVCHVCSPLQGLCW